MSTPSTSPVQADNDSTGVTAPTVSHMSVMMRSNAIVVLAFIAVVVFLQWAQAVSFRLRFPYL